MKTTKLQQISSECAASLNNRGSYSIRVKIGICYYNFRVRKFSTGYVLMKNEDLLTEYPKAEQIVTALCENIQYHV